MSNAATLVSPASNQRMPVAGAILLGLAAILALGFLAMFALPYSTLDETTFGRFWPKRGWLLTHIAGGMVALLVGPVQIWLGLTRRKTALHRVLGKVYLAAVVVGGISSFGLSLTTEAGWIFGMGLAFLGLAWFVTTGMALAAVLRRRFELHKEWMIRSYVVTFAFVNFRILSRGDRGDGRRNRVGAHCGRQLVLLGGPAACDRSLAPGASDVGTFQGDLGVIDHGEIVPLTSGTRLGVYEVTALIGQGGMGEVYRARDTKLWRDVALKVRQRAARLCWRGAA